MRHRIPAFAIEPAHLLGAGHPPAVAHPEHRAHPEHTGQPEALHPALWRAHQLGQVRGVVCPTGWPELDVELPGGGWPQGLLTELLLNAPGVGEMRLLAPALAAVAAQGRCVMLFDPPAVLCARALAELGVPSERLLVVHGREGARGAATLRHLLPSADLLWALEQSLRCGHVGAVLAWLPARLKADALRRLQLAAQAHEGPVFLLRHIDDRLKPSPAPLRLGLASAGADVLSLRLFKRRGPALAQPLRLALPPVVVTSAAVAATPSATASATALDAARVAAHGM